MIGNGFYIVGIYKTNPYLLKLFTQFLFLLFSIYNTKIRYLLFIGQKSDLLKCVTFYGGSSKSYCAMDAPNAARITPPKKCLRNYSVDISKITE